MDTDKAYIFGLIIGGGDFGNAEDVFRIRLPYKKWGSYKDNPKRAGRIIEDILKKLSPIFRTIYNLTIQYETSKSGEWIILCEGDTSGLKEDLLKYGITDYGEIRKYVKIDKFISELVDDNMKRRFIAGLADTIGSISKSHRRFTDENQIISLEISGFNYEFVCALCHLLYSIDCIPDQVNWNHPNIHCTSDCYYKKWNKGFKLRILLDQYAKFGAFAFRTKAESLRENLKFQKKTHKAKPCEERTINIKPSTVHIAEDDLDLPEKIRGGHYINFKHFCAVLGCEHAPYERVKSCFNSLGDYIIPFPILCKDKYSVISNIINSDKLLSERKYDILDASVSHLMDIHDGNPKSLVYGDSALTGYPIAEVLQGVAYVIAKDNELFGKRLKGAYLKLILRHLSHNSNLSIEIRKPDLLTPLIVIGNDRGALIGARNPDVYKRLISFDPLTIIINGHAFSIVDNSSGYDIIYF